LFIKIKQKANKAKAKREEFFVCFFFFQTRSFVSSSISFLFLTYIQEKNIGLGIAFLSFFPRLYRASSPERILHLPKCDFFCCCCLSKDQFV